MFGREIVVPGSFSRPEQEYRLVIRPASSKLVMKDWHCIGVIKWVLLFEREDKVRRNLDKKLISKLARPQASEAYLYILQISFIFTPSKMEADE